MSKPSQLLDSINQQLAQLNKNQLDMMAKQSITHTEVKHLRIDYNKHDKDIDTLKEGHFKRLGGWQMFLMIGSALLSVGAIIAALIK